MKKFGFKNGKNSTHIRRTIMLEELETLLEAVPNATSIQDYLYGIEEINCLGKRTEKNRKYTGEYLIELYTLDPHIPLFRTLLYFWKRETEGHPLLALLCAVSRDPILKASLKVILETPESTVLERQKMEAFIDSFETGRFSKTTLVSIAQNLDSSWTKSGHLAGRAKKIRSRASATPATVAYALYLSHLEGIRGMELFETDYLKMMDCSREKCMELAEIASMRGWMIFKRIGNIIEVSFPNLIS